MELLKDLSTLFQRDLESLCESIGKYRDEDSLWTIKGSISNPAGNLALHLEGNLKHFIGAVLGGTGYERDRDHEFQGKDIPKEELVDRLKGASKVVVKTLQSLDQKDLERTYPYEVFGHAMTTRFFLIHLLGHLNYHRGQIDYHRRIIEGDQV